MWTSTKTQTPANIRAWWLQRRFLMAYPRACTGVVWSGRWGDNPASSLDLVLRLRPWAWFWCPPPWARTRTCCPNSSTLTSRPRRWTGPTVWYWPKLMSWVPTMTWCWRRWRKGRATAMGVVQGSRPIAVLAGRGLGRLCRRLFLRLASLLLLQTQKNWQNRPLPTGYLLLKIPRRQQTVMPASKSLDRSLLVTITDHFYAPSFIKLQLPVALPHTALFLSL